MEWRGHLSIEVEGLNACEVLRAEGKDKFPSDYIRLWFDPSRLPQSAPRLRGIKIGDTLRAIGESDQDIDPVATTINLYNTAGRLVAERGNFGVSWTLLNPDWNHESGYGETVRLGAIWGKTDTAAGLSFGYDRRKGSRTYSDLDYAVELFQQIAIAGNIPLSPIRRDDTICVVPKAHCDFVSLVLQDRLDPFSARGFTGDFISMVKGVKSVLDRHAITATTRHWHLESYIAPFPGRIPEDPPDVMAEKFLKTICGADLPADRYEVQIHFAFTSVQGLEFVRAFCGPKNEFLFPLVELTPEKGVKVLASVGVKPEGYYLQLASRKDLKPEFLADLEARFGTTFSPVRKPEKSPRKKK